MAFLEKSWTVLNNTKFFQFPPGLKQFPPGSIKFYDSDFRFPFGRGSWVFPTLSTPFAEGKSWSIPNISVKNC